MNFRIHRFENLSSTLDEAADRKYTHCDVVVARFQSDGRGQRGNKWHSDEGLNLMATIVVKPTHLAVNEQFAVSMIAALATAQTVRSYGVECVEIKWPNDIYVGEKKISGILIEHSFSSEMLGRSLIGIGVNVAQMEFGEDAGNPTSLHLLGVGGATVEGVLGRLCDNLGRFYSLSIDELHCLYFEHLYRGRGFHRYRDRGGEFLARVGGIDARSGVLTLIDDEGRHRDYYFKEVSYIN